MTMGIEEVGVGQLQVVRAQQVGIQIVGRIVPPAIQDALCTRLLAEVHELIGVRRGLALEA